MNTAMLKKFFGDRAFWRDALKLALPISLQNLLVSSFAMVDSFMVGTLGEEALAAVGMAGKLSWLLNLVLFGFNSGAAVFIAQFWGVKDEDSIRKSFGLATLSALCAALGFTILGGCAPEWVMRFFTKEETAILLGSEYLRLAVISYTAVCLNNLMATLLRSTENPKLPLYASLLSVSANALLNALFIYGLEMGVRGAALATAISSWISPILLFVLSMKQRNMLCAPLHKFIGWTKQFVKSYYVISVPALLNETIWALGTVAYNAIYSNASTDFYAAFTIFSSVEGLIFAFFVGLCHASAVLVGKQVGAGEYKHAFGTACRFTAVMPLLSLALGLLILLARPLLLLPYANVAADTRMTAAVLILIYSLELALRNIPYITIVGVFRSGGDTKCGLLYDLGCLWGVALPVTYIGVNVLGLPLTTVFLIMLLSEDLVKSVFCIRRLLSRKWIRPVTDGALHQA